MARRGAGGTSGGEGAFILGLIMMIAGGYLLLKGIIIRPQFGMGMTAFSVGGFPVTTGMIFVPFMFGIGLIFYNAKLWAGWLLALGSVVALVAGVLASITLSMAGMSVFELMMILVLLVGGVGLFLRSLVESRR